MSAITKAHLVNHLYVKLGISKRESKRIVDLFFAQMVQVLQRGEDVKLSGFGGFSLRNKKERPGRNPRTGEMVSVSARRVVTFKAGEKLKAKISAYAKSKEKATANRK